MAKCKALTGSAVKGLTAQLAKTSSAFNCDAHQATMEGSCHKTAWTLDTKAKCYRVQSSYSDHWEPWVFWCRHIVKIDQFHGRVMSTAHIPYNDGYDHEYWNSLRCNWHWSFPPQQSTGMWSQSVNQSINHLFFWAAQETSTMQNTVSNRTAVRLHWTRDIVRHEQQSARPST